MKMLGYFWVFTLEFTMEFTPRTTRDDSTCYKIPVYNYIGSKNQHRAIRACEEKHNKLASTCEKIRTSGYVPEKIAICTSGIYVTGKRKDGRTKTVRV